MADGGRQKLLPARFKLQTERRGNIFATSRFIPDITKDYTAKSTVIEIRATNEDVERYLDGRMSQLPSFVKGYLELQDEIKTEIVKVVSGICVYPQAS